MRSRLVLCACAAYDARLCLCLCLSCVLGTSVSVIQDFCQTHDQRTHETTQGEGGEKQRQRPATHRHTRTHRRRRRRRRRLRHRHRGTRTPCTLTRAHRLALVAGRRVSLGVHRTSNRTSSSSSHLFARACATDTRGTQHTETQKTEKERNRERERERDGRTREDDAENGWMLREGGRASMYVARMEQASPAVFVVVTG